MLLWKWGKNTVKKIAKRGEFQIFQIFSVSFLRFGFFCCYFSFSADKRKSKMTRAVDGGRVAHSRKGRQRKSIWLFVSLQKYLVEINLRYRRRIPSLSFCVVVFEDSHDVAEGVEWTARTMENHRHSFAAQQPFHFIPFCWRQTEKVLFIVERDVMRFCFVNANSYAEVIHLHRQRRLISHLERFEWTKGGRATFED